MINTDNNNNGDMVLFRFLGCDGLGLQQADSLTRITGDVFMDRFPSTTIYLLDAKGNICCSVLADKARYEGYDNQDRRQSNIANGFNIIWDHDGATCTVYRSAPARKTGCAGVIITLMALIIGALAAWFITWLVMDSKISDARDEERARYENMIARQKEQTAVPAAANESNSAAEEMFAQAAAEAEAAMEEAAAEAEAAMSKAEEAVMYAGRRVDLRIEATTMRSRLQRNDCTSKTVEQVRNWYNKLSAAERKLVNETYKFEEGIDAYSAFFNATSPDDCSRLYKESASLFSPGQQNYIREFGNLSSMTFKRERSAYGMRFVNPAKRFEKPAK